MKDWKEVVATKNILSKTREPTIKLTNTRYIRKDTYSPGVIGKTQASGWQYCTVVGKVGEVFIVVEH